MTRTTPASWLVVALVLRWRPSLAGVALAPAARDGGWRSRSPLGGCPPTAPACPTGRSTSSSRTTSSPSSASSTTRGGGYGGGGTAAAGAGGGWTTDWPDSDLNFSYRLQQLTSLKVNPTPISLRLTDEQLFDYPFLYMIEPGALLFSEEEVDRAAALPAQRRLPDGRRLLGRRRVGELLPSRSSASSPTASRSSCRSTTRSSSCVYRLKEKPQVPSIHSWYGRGRTSPGSSATAATPATSTTGASSTTRGG